ncbi:MAG: GntR family transcriptional regulator [Dongiaceae bacterium]
MRTQQPELDRKGLDQDVAGKLREAIFRGELSAGARLTELDLADRWQVSQGTIRAALKDLRHEGLVEYRPRRGTVVTSFTEADVVEIYTLRDSLEALAARWAAASRSEGGCRALEQVLKGMRSAVAARQRKRMLDLDFEFHRTIVEMSGHKRLIDVYARLEAQTRLFLTMTDRFHHNLDGLLAIHEPLANAIVKGDVERAFALASHHSEHDGKELAAMIFAGREQPKDRA